MKLDVVRFQLLRECTESRETLGQYKKRDNIIKNGNFLCLSCASASLALQHGGSVPREWPAAKTQRGHCYLYHTDAIRHYSVGIKQFSWNVSLLRRGLFVRLGKGKKKARARGGRWEGKTCCLRKREVLNKAASSKKCHQIHTYGILFLQYLIQVLSLVVYWPVTTKRLTRNIYMNMLL